MAREVKDDGRSGIMFPIVDTFSVWRLSFRTNVWSVCGRLCRNSSSQSSVDNSPMRTILVSLCGANIWGEGRRQKGKASVIFFISKNGDLCGKISNSDISGGKGMYSTSESRPDLILKEIKCSGKFDGNGIEWGPVEPPCNFKN
jgi:hypothetical protein